MKHDFKRISTNTLKKSGIFFTIFIAIIGVLSATGYVISLLLVCQISFVAILSIWFFFYYTDSRNEELIDEPELLDDSFDFVISYDTKSDCRILNERTKKLFGSDFINNELAESWRSVNPKGFLCLKDSANNIYAGITLLSIVPECFKFFKEGRIAENDIDNECLNSFDKSLINNDLYIALIIVVRIEDKTNRHSLPMLIWGFFEYLKKYYYSENGCKHTIYALPLNKNSENLLKRFGFTIYYNEKRKDKHQLYYLDLTYENLERASKRVPDFSKICKLEFDNPISYT